MIYRVSHRTTYRYSQPVAIAHHLLHLEPRRCDRQTCRSAGLAVLPKPAVLRVDADYFGNPVTYLTIQEPHSALDLHAECLVETAPSTPPDPDATPPWETVPALLSRDLSPAGLAVFEFAFDSPHTVSSADLVPYARESFPPGRPLLAGALDLMRRIHRDFAYDSTATTVSTPVETVFAERRGVCQDFAHVQIACLRSLGLSARYVSGYLLTHPPEGGERLVGADASHAWLSVWCPGHGWIDLDPTNDMIPSAEHITIAWGRDYADVSPVTGVIVGGGEHEVAVAVDVVPIPDDETADAVESGSMAGE